MCVSVVRGRGRQERRERKILEGDKRIRLTAGGAGDGQYRIRMRRFRFIYDIDGQTVFLKACALRREDTY